MHWRRQRRRDHYRVHNIQKALGSTWARLHLLFVRSVPGTWPELSAYTPVFDVQLLLESGLSVEHYIGMGTLLAQAVRWRKVTLIHILIAIHSADVNRDNGLPMRLAAYNGFHDILDILITRGADVNLTYNSYTALKRAIIDQNLPVISRLISAGATPPPDFLYLARGNKDIPALLFPKE